MRPKTSPAAESASRFRPVLSATGRRLADVNSTGSVVEIKHGKIVTRVDWERRVVEQHGPHGVEVGGLDSGE